MEKNGIKIMNVADCVHNATKHEILFLTGFFLSRIKFNLSIFRRDSKITFNSFRN